MPDTGTLIILGGGLGLGFCAGFLVATWRAANVLVPRIRETRS